MKKVLLFLTAFVLLICGSTAHATTYYIRPDGGNLDQCNGLYDAPYPDFSGNKNCALYHWNLIHGVAGDGNASIFKGGDTMVIDGGTTSQYQYIAGWGSPAIVDYSVCGSSWPWGCTMKPIPSGTSSQPTRVLGKGWDTGCTNPPQIWGNERVGSVLNLSGSNNVEVQCLEITDHSECQEIGPNACKRDAKPFGPWATNGIFAKDSSNVLLKNVNVHGLALRGINVGRISNWTIEDSKFIGNAFVGWDGDIGADTSSNSGTIKFVRTQIKYNGCGERLNGSPYDCFSQSQGGYGDGLGTATTGGDWIFDNVDISNNVSDGLDLLYHNGNGSITIKNSRFEKNAGNQVKTASNVNITNTYIDGECSDFADKSYTYKPSTFDNCRALGNAFSFRVRAGYKMNLENVTAINNTGDVILLTGGSTCNGTESVNVNKSKFSADTEYLSGEKVTLFYNSGATGNGDGACGHIPLNATNYSVYNVKEGCPSGATCVKPESAPSTWGYQGVVVPPCTPNGTCSAPEPACEQTTTGIDNCGNTCTKTGAACPCVPNGSCDAPEPACEQTTTGVDNCGNSCTKVGVPCNCVPDGSCNAIEPPCGQTTVGEDNCGNLCNKVGVPCTEPTGFPINISEDSPQGAVTFNIQKTQEYDNALVTLTVYDAENPTEGEMIINDHDPIILFQGVGDYANDQLVAQLTWTVPGNYIVNGENTFRFKWRNTLGFRVDNIEVAFSNNPVPCVPDGSCNAPEPACEQTTTGEDNCGNTCTKIGDTCPCIPDGSCDAQTPQCEQTTTGKDNCGNTCTKVGEPCQNPGLTFTTISSFERWLNDTTIQQADSQAVIKGIRIGNKPSNYKYYKITIQSTTP